MKQLDLFENKKKYKYWEVLDKIPQGWVIDKTAGSPAPKTVFITNGKSPVSGEQKRAILRVETKSIKLEANTTPVNKLKKKEDEEEDSPHVFPSKTVNNLARAKFKEQILKEIMFDFMVCEIEGWSKLDYIKEIKQMIDSIKI